MKLKLLFLFLLISSACFSQGIRVGDSLPLQTTAVIQGTTVIVPVGIASIQMCNAPANATPCTNKATTYTDRTLGTPCSTATQVVLAGTSSCVANSDSIGNWGVWVASGNYEWTFTNSSGASFGPYPVTANSSPNTNAWSALSAPTANVSVAHAAFTSAFTWSGLANSTYAWTIRPTASGGLGFLGNGDVVLGASANNPPAAFDILYSNNTGAGTAAAQDKLACFNSTGGAILCATTQTAGALIGICRQSCGSSSQVIATSGLASCAFDNSVTVTDWVTVSSTIAGDCHDAGSSVPATSVSTVGRVLATGAASTYTVLLEINR